MEFAFPFVFPWHLGAGLYRVPPIIQISDLFGVYGVTALIVAVNAALWELLRFLRRKTAFPWLSLATATGLIAASLLYGFWRIALWNSSRKGHLIWRWVSSRQTSVSKRGARPCCGMTSGVAIDAFLVRPSREERS